MGICKEKKTVFLIFFFVCFIYLFPIFNDFSFQGQYEWDQFTFFSAVQRKTILFFKQFPLWNNFSNGGNLMLAHPYSFFLSPIFPLILIFGTIPGIKIGILFFLLCGALGIYSLLRYFKINFLGSFLSGVIYILNGYFASQIEAGRMAELMNMCIFPWFFYFYLKSFEDKVFILASMITLTFIIFGGSTDILGGTLLFILIYSLFSLFIKRKARHFKISLWILSGAIGLGAIKIIPASLFIFKNLKAENFSMTIPLNILFTVLLGRNQVYYEQNTIGYWLECGSYIGILTFLLFIIGCIFKYRERSALLCTGLFFLLLVLKSPLNLWQLVRKFPFYCFQYSTGRYIIFFIFVLTVFSGFGLNSIEEKLKHGFFSKKQNVATIIGVVVCLLIATDLFVTNRPAIENTFINPPIKTEGGGDFIQRESNASYIFERSAMYPVFLMNNGIVDSYERVSLKKGNLLTKPFNNSVPMRLGVHDFIRKGDRDTVISAIRNMEADLGKKGFGFDWKIIRPIQGLDGKHLSCRFSLHDPNAPYFDVVPAGKHSLWHIFYIMFYIYSPRELERVSMEVGGASDIRIWLDDKSIFSDEQESLRREGKRVFLDLRRGWSKMVLRGVEIIGGFKDSMLGFTKIERDGKILDDISYDVLKEYNPQEEIKFVYKGEAYLKDNLGKIDYVRISPNKIDVSLVANEEDRLILNQNFHEGWNVSNNLKVEPYDGLISVNVPKGTHNLELYFLPADFIVGFVISIISLSFIVCKTKRLIHER